MTQKETEKVIRDIPIGSRIQIIKKNGHISEVRLASHDLSGIEEKDYGNLVVPAQPPAIIVNGRVRFGNYRIELDKIVNIAHVE